MGIADQAKQIIDNPLPIKCLEAVILSIYLINEIPNSTLEKFTIGFKSISKGNVHRHVVLGVYCHSTGMFGVLGMSRRQDLGYKPLEYKTLTDLLLDYIESYTTYLHRIKRIKIGMPIPKSNRSFETIVWNGVNIVLNKHTPTSEWIRQVEKHARVIKHTNMPPSINFGLRQATSLRNLTTAHENSTLSTSSYLSRHIQKFSKIPKPDVEGEDDDDDDDEYAAVNDEVFPDSETIAGSDDTNDDEKFKSEKNFLPRTAPIRPSFSPNSSKLKRKGTQQISASSNSLIDNLKNKNSIGFLSKNFDVKRKMSSSLRV